GIGPWNIRETLPGVFDVDGVAGRCDADGLSLWTGSPRGGALLTVAAGAALHGAAVDTKVSSDVFVADLDGDGFDDLVTHDWYALIVAHADGTGGFGPARRLEFAGLISAIAIGEFDGRPGAELLVRARGDTESKYGWRLWSAVSGSIEEGAPLALGNAPMF